MFRATATAVDGLQLGVLARRFHRMDAAIRDRVVALARVIGAVAGHGTDLLVWRDLVEQLGQNRRIADRGGDFDRPDLQRSLVDPEVDLGHRRRLEPPCLRACHSPSSL